jgi:hypothetical protein
VASEAPFLGNSTTVPFPSVGLELTAVNPEADGVPLPFIKAMFEGLGARIVVFVGSDARLSRIACFLAAIRCRNWRPLAATANLSQ